MPNGRPFPTTLDPFQCNRYELAKFAREAHDLDVRYIGVCCGNSPAHTREVAEALGRRPEASRYSPVMSSTSLSAPIPPSTLRRLRLRRSCKDGNRWKSDGTTSQSATSYAVSVSGVSAMRGRASAPAVGAPMR